MRVIAMKRETDWHSPQDTVNGETTLSPMRRVEYSSGRPVALGEKLEPSAMTSPMNSWPHVRLLERGQEEAKIRMKMDGLAIDVFMTAIDVEVASTQSGELENDEIHESPLDGWNVREP